MHALMVLRRCHTAAYTCLPQILTSPHTPHCTPVHLPPHCTPLPFAPLPCLHTLDIHLLPLPPHFFSLHFCCTRLAALFLQLPAHTAWISFFFCAQVHSATAASRRAYAHFTHAAYRFITPTAAHATHTHACNAAHIALALHYATFRIAPYFHSTALCHNAHALPALAIIPPPLYIAHSFPDYSCVGTVDVRTVAAHGNCPHTLQTLLCAH